MQYLGDCLSWVSDEAPEVVDEVSRIAMISPYDIVSRLLFEFPACGTTTRVSCFSSDDSSVYIG